MLRRLSKAVFVVLFVLAFSSAALALPPEDALSARPAESVYSVIRIDNLNGLLRDIFSEPNVALAMSFLKLEDKQLAELVAEFAAQVPAKSVIILSGITAGSADKKTFVQIAVSLPPSLGPKLERVADGSASGVDGTAFRDVAATNDRSRRHPISFVRD